MSIKEYLFISLVILSANLFGQSFFVKGLVLDSNSNEPVAFANVYLAQTTIGTSTNDLGNFGMEVSGGRYQLVISHIGYDQYIQNIVFNSDTTLLIKAQSRTEKLNEVIVSPDTTNWLSNYKLFVDLFIGETKNASLTKIENPKDIYFFYDSFDNTLFAFSNKELIIINEALGYKIFYTLKKFEMNFKSGFLMSYGMPRFQALQTTSKKQLKIWKRNKKRAYKGSFTHFIDALKQDKIEENDFQVTGIFRKKNDKDTTEIRKKIAYFREKLMNSSKTKDSLVLSANNPIMDSLSYWHKMKNSPDYLDSLGGTIINQRELMPNPDMICCKKILRITYLGEWEEEGYLSQKGFNAIRVNRQTTLVHFSNDGLNIYENRFYDVEKLIFEGYLGWHSKLAEILPLNYKIDLNNHNK